LAAEDTLLGTGVLVGVSGSVASMVQTFAKVITAKKAVIIVHPCTAVRNGN
jgi:hypothetical protein